MRNSEILKTYLIIALVIVLWFCFVFFAMDFIDETGSIISIKMSGEEVESISFGDKAGKLYADFTTVTGATVSKPIYDVRVDLVMSSDKVHIAEDKTGKVILYTREDILRKTLDNGDLSALTTDQVNLIYDTLLPLPTRSTGSRSTACVPVITAAAMH